MEETIVKEEPVIEAPKTEEVVTETVAPAGAKTDPALLLKSLREERARIKELESELIEARKASENTGAEVFSDEGKVLEAKISTLEARLANRDEIDRLTAVHSTYPIIKDKQQEFDDFRNASENAGMRIETAAKAFLVENDLLERPKQRKGLEKETGGVRVAPKVGRSPEEIDELRVNNYRQYVKELRAGTLNG